MKIFCQERPTLVPVALHEAGYIYAQRMFNLHRREWLVRIVIALLVILCANTLRRTGEPRVFYLQIINGVVASLMLNTALLLSFFVVRRWARCVLAAALVPTALGVTFVMTDYGITAAVLALGFHVWLIVALMRSSKPI